MGPSVNTEEKIEQLIEAGMNVARLNFSHGSHEEHANTIRMLKNVRQKMNCPLAIMLDTKGPEIRIGKIKNGQFEIAQGEHIWLVKENLEGDSEKISVFPSIALDVLKKGMTILIDNGYIIANVVEVEKERVRILIEHGGAIKSSKGLNIPGVNVELPALTERDVLDIEFGCRHDVDLIAASFVRSADHVMAIKKILEKQGKPEIAVIAKIENSLGVQNFDSIVQVADGIMVARGDLGVELPLSQVPRLQKMMIRKSYLAGKPSVTATQMLESMINNPRPTRAEASDVANAIYDSTSAVMLSGETAVGRYPIETVKMMRSIIEEAERDFNYYDFFNHTTQRVFNDVPSAVAQASVKTAYSANARAIFAFTSSGSTARLLSRLRPEMPIIALTPKTKSYHQLALNWGVIPIMCEMSHTIEESYERISLFALEHGIVKYGDLVVITAGTPFGAPGTTNMMIVDSIGDVLVRGTSGYGPHIHGKVAIVVSPEQKSDYLVKGKIVVLSKCDDSYLPILRSVSGIILQNNIDDEESERYLLTAAQTLGLSVLLRADNASSILRDEQLVTLDPEQAIVYKGIIYAK